MSITVIQKHVHQNLGQTAEYTTSSTKQNKTTINDTAAAISWRSPNLRHRRTPALHTRHLGRLLLYLELKHLDGEGPGCEHRQLAKAEQVPTSNQNHIIYENI